MKPGFAGSATNGTPSAIVGCCFFFLLIKPASIINKTLQLADSKLEDHMDTEFIPLDSSPVEQGKELDEADEVWTWPPILS